jgi:hypothetical protein
MTDMNYEEMIEQVKENIKKVEAEGQEEAQFAFASAQAASDFYYNVIKEIDGWVIKSVESRLVPRHYQNSAVLERGDENKKGTLSNEEEKPSDV